MARRNTVKAVSLNAAARGRIWNWNRHGHGRPRATAKAATKSSNGGHLPVPCGNVTPLIFENVRSISCYNPYKMFSRTKTIAIFLCDFCQTHFGPRLLSIMLRKKTCYEHVFFKTRFFFQKKIFFGVKNIFSKIFVSKNKLNNTCAGRKIEPKTCYRDPYRNCFKFF